MGKPIIIIGMSRSGTTFLSRALAKLYSCKLIVEPHLLWKCAELPCLSDDVFQISEKSSKLIRSVINEYAESDFFIEKSPINILRPYKVHSAFPDAFIIYVSRNKDRVVKSNIARFNSGDQFSIRIFIEKFLSRKGAGVLQHEGEVYIPLKRQINSNWFGFFLHSVYGLIVKNFLVLPFGPKIHTWKKLAGIETYYDEVIKTAEANSKIYEILYRDNFYNFDMDNFESSFKTFVDRFEKGYSLEVYDEIIHASGLKSNG